MSGIGTERPPGKSLFRSVSGAKPTWHERAESVAPDPTRTRGLSQRNLGGPGVCHSKADGASILENLPDLPDGRIKLHHGEMACSRCTEGQHAIGPPEVMHVIGPEGLHLTITGLSHALTKNADDKLSAGNMPKRVWLECRHGGVIMAEQTIWRGIEMNLGGAKVSGSYEVSNGIVTVRSAFGRKSTQVGGSVLHPEGLARIMLRELVRESLNNEVEA